MERRLAAALLVLAACSVAQGQVVNPNNGGHFRFATMFWKAVQTDPPSNTVEITIESAWRRSYSSNYFTAAQTPDGMTLMQINGKESPMLDLGDGKIKYLESVKITAWSQAEDWFLGEQVFTHVYDTPNNAGTPWRVRFKGCCRLSTLINNAGKSWDMGMDISLTDTTASPRVVSLPVVYAQRPAPGLPAQVSFNLRTAIGATVGWQIASAGLNAPADHNALPATVSLDMAGNVTVVTTQTGLVHILAYAYDTARPTVQVPVDLLVSITPAADTDPQFTDATMALFSQNRRARPGFEFSADISGFIKRSNDDSLYVGFTVGPLPPGARLSTVRGKGVRPTDPATMTLKWTPCTAQLGRAVVCFDVVNSLGVAATQRCLTIDVVEDVAPVVAITFGGRAMGPDDTAVMYIGAEYTLSFTATDSNPLDMLMLMPSDGDGNPCEAPCMPVPPGARMTRPATTVMPDVAVSTSSNMTFAPAHNHGGYWMRHCATAVDSCGTPCGQTQCPGVVHKSTACIYIKVERCQFIVRQGQELQEIAAMYHTDWLQLWSHNQQLLSPDTNLMPGSIISIGHVYAVQPFDKPSEVGKRFGMSAEMFNMLNTDIAMGRMDHEICQSIQECESMRWCILPSSCNGDSGSIYQGAYADQPWFSSTVTQPSAPVPAK